MKFLASFSQFLGRTFAAWVIAAAILAYLWPAAFRPFASWISVLLGFVMFGMGLTLSWRDFSEVLTRPRDVLIGIAGQFLIMPAVAWGLCAAMGLPPEIAVGVMLVGCCPGGTASNVMTYLARGDVALSVTITSCTTLLAPFATPALMYLFANQWIAVDPVGMFWSICQIVLIPVALGVAVHAFFGKATESAASAVPMISVVSIVLIVSAVVAVSQPRLASTGALIFAVVVVHNALGLALGYFFGSIFGMNAAKRKCLSIEIGMQNSGLGVALAAAHFAAAPLAAVPSAIFSVWHNISGPVVATLDRRMRD